MEVVLEAKSQILIASLKGELDHHSVDEVREQLEGALNDMPFIKHLLLDLKDLEFMDSSGVGVLIGRYKVIASRGGKAAVINLSPQIKRIFEISGLFQIFVLYNSRQEALKNLI